MKKTNRYIYETENLKSEDFNRGYGFDISLYNKLRNHPNRLNVITEKESYYLFTHTGIDGIERKERFHPILGKVIININDSNKRCIIESLHKHWYYGYYWVIVYRMEGTKSHGTGYIKNINSINDIVIDSVGEFNKDYIFEDVNFKIDEVL